MRGLLSDRKNLVPALALALSALVLVLSAAFYSDAKEELNELRTQSAAFASLIKEARALMVQASALDERGSLTEAAGVVEAAGLVFSSAGIKGKLKSVTPLGTRDIHGTRAEEAEIKAEGLTIEETVALMYRVSNAPMRLTVKRAEFRRSFEEPEMLEITMTVSFVLPGQ